MPTRVTLADYARRIDEMGRNTSTYDVLRTFVELVQADLVAGRTVVLRGLGTLRVLERRGSSAGVSGTPRPDHLVTHFKSGKTLKRMLQERREL